MRKIRILLNKLNTNGKLTYCATLTYCNMYLDLYSNTINSLLSLSTIESSSTRMLIFISFNFVLLLSGDQLNFILLLVCLALTHSSTYSVCFHIHLCYMYIAIALSFYLHNARTVHTHTHMLISDSYTVMPAFLHACICGCFTSNTSACGFFFVAAY